MDLRHILFQFFTGLCYIGVAGADSGSSGYTIKTKILHPTDDLKKLFDDIVFVDKGEKVQLKCESSGNRPVQWRKSGDQTGAWCKANVCTQETLTISNAAADDSGTYECFFTHEHVAKTDSVKVYVRDKNLVTVNPSENFVLTNETVFLNFTCTSRKSSDLAKATWTLNGKDVADVDSKFTSYDNGSLHLRWPKGKHSGVYVCAIPRDETRFYYSFVVVEGPGYVYQKHETSLNLMQGDTAELKCEVYGFPTPKVTWLINMKSLENETGRVFYDKYNGVENAKLRIVELDYVDRANYTCNAANTHGNGLAHTFVRVKDKLAALWPFLGIVAEVVILVTIIFLYEKRRAKKEAEEPDESAEQKKALTEGGSDVRQRAVKA